MNKLTVGELIERLQEYPEDAIVTRPATAEEAVDEIAIVGVGDVQGGRADFGEGDEKDIRSVVRLE